MHLTDRYTWQSVIKCAKHACLRGVGAYPPPPKKSFDFRPSEIVSGAVLR